jgi:hypothetical protein
MNTFDRRQLLTTAIGAGAVVTAGRCLESAAGAADPPQQRIKIGQIGTANQHAYKIGTLRKLTDLFEVVGFVEDDPKLREKARKSSCFKGLKSMSTDELLAVPGLQAVAIETEERVCIPPALRCIRAGKHIHLDKPCGESLPEFKQLRVTCPAESSRLLWRKIAAVSRRGFRPLICRR